MAHSTNPASPSKKRTLGGVAPTLIHVTDPNGVEIPEKGSTCHTEAHVFGIAPPGVTVTLFNGKDSLAEAIADPDGYWDSSISIGARLFIRITARTSQNPDAVSNERTFGMSPFILSVTGADGSVIADGGTTGVDNMTVIGKGVFAAGPISLWDNDVYIGNLPVSPDGDWSIELDGLEAGRHELKIGQVLEGTTMSWTWTFVKQ